MALPFLIRCAVFGTGLLWAAASAFGAAGTAVIRMFDATEAPIKEAVRSVLVTRDGTLIVGSNELAAFDGLRGQKIDVPVAYGFRALAESRSQDRIFIGAIDTLGYIERDATGTWRFTRLNSGLNVGDVWSVHAVGHGAVWVGTDRVFRWHGERIETLALPNPTQLAGFSEGDAVLVYQDGAGLLRIGLTGAPEVLVRDSELPQKPVTWLVAAPDEAGHSMRLIGLRDGAYRWDGGKQFVRVDALSTSLHGSIPTSATNLADGRVAIGTFNAGIVIASSTGDVIGRAGKADGLGPGNVFALTGRGDQLWAALPEGLARIDAPGRAKRFDRRQDLDEGTPRRALAVGETEYLLTSSGLFESAARGVEQRAAFAKPVWSAVHAANATWIGGFGGIWRAGGGKVEQVHYVSTDVLTLAPSERLSEGVLFTEGYALKSLLPSLHGGWATRELGFRATDTPVSLLEDGQGQVWLSTMRAGIFRLRWTEERKDEAPLLQFVSHYREQFGINTALTRPRLTLLKGNLFVLAEEGIFRLRDDRAGFTAVGELADFAGIAATEAGPDGSAHWLVRHRGLGPLGALAVVRVKQTDGGQLQIERLDVPGLDTGAWTGIDSVDGAVWLTGSRGALRVAATALRPAAQPPTLHLTGVRWQEDGSSGPRGVGFTFPAATASSGALVFYQTRLTINGDGTWSAPNTDSQREFSSLAPGTYGFEARAIDRFGRTGPSISYAFTIPLPWWRTSWAWTGYGLALLLMILGAARWRIERLQRQNERLNRLVSDRTRELELSNTAKSEFLENISHEIRNPLNGLTGLLTLLKEERMEPEERARVKSLRAVTSTLTRVFEDVLQFSKLEYGYAQLHPRPFRLRKTLDELLALFATTAQAQDCALSLKWPPELADGFVGDEDKIRTVVGNFISNALKYAPGAPVEIRVMATEETAGHVDLYIDVIDHGRGIPAEEQGLIFKKFVRGTQAKEEEIPGTGLGLATCNVLARLMNGQVSVESVPGKGATFSLRLLLPRAPDGALTTSSEANEVAEGDRPRALIVDDEPYNRTVLEGLAGELGFRADLTGNAREAMDRVARNSYRVIFLDWELPGLKGGDVARQIRARPAGGEPIIFATTAHDSDEMQERCREAGMDGFLLKPFNAAAIRRALDGVTAWRRERNESSAKSNFWSENPVRRGTGLDLRAFDQYERARPNQPGNARADFIRTLEEQMAALEGALAEGDSATVAGTAHRLRALAGLIHAEELNAAATKLEELARKGSDEQCAFQTKITLAAGQALRAKLDRESGQ